MDFLDKNNNPIQNGDVIRWNCYDSEEFHTWTFTGIYLHGKVIYLGGGLDFGMGIGQVKEIEEVIEESDNNDDIDRGIEKIGIAHELSCYIGDFKD